MYLKHCNELLVSITNFKENGGELKAREYPLHIQQIYSASTMVQ